MSGIGIQKLNGAGTAAQAQLTELEKIVAAINKNSSPDLKAWFKLLFPDLPIIPFYKAISISDGSDGVNIIPIGKTVFAEITMGVTCADAPDSGEESVGTIFHAMLDGSGVFSVMKGLVGDNELNLTTTSQTFVGIVDGFWLQSWFYGAGSFGRAVIKGFVIPDAFNIATLETLPEEGDELPP